MTLSDGGLNCLTDNALLCGIVHPQRPSRGSRGIVPAELYKSELRGPFPSTEARPQLKTTPIRFSFHHTTRQGMQHPSARRMKWSGIPMGVATSSIAPVSDILRIMQVIAPPPNSIVPAFKTRLRGDARLFMDVLSGGTLIPKRSQIRDFRIQVRTLALNTASAVRFLERR